MHLEVQVALNFFIGHLYNKLPRRRVNLFGEELERALKMKFANHWYPDKPMKGSAYRCLKTGNPTDPVLERAAQEANVSISDILENLPADMSVWIDPGEVSYRIGEKGQMKILWSENSGDQMDELNADREVTKTFNPDAQIFQPIEAARKSVSPFSRGGLGGLTTSPNEHQPLQPHPHHHHHNGSPFGGEPPSSSTSSSFNNNYNPAPPFPPQIGFAIGSSRSSQPAGLPVLANPNKVAPPAVPAPGGWNPHHHPTANQPQLMTTAAFAQTKFGSTKLKTSSKRTHRMSPTEFSNYIKQRALQQQQQKAQQQQQVVAPIGAGAFNNPRPRSLSPQDFGPFSGLGGSTYQQEGGKYNPFETAIWGCPSPTGGLSSAAAPSPTNNSSSPSSNSSQNGFGGQQQPFDTNRQLLEGLSLGLNAAPYRGQYQHLLVAN